jgi:hypothetical protein
MKKSLVKMNLLNLNQYEDKITKNKMFIVKKAEQHEFFLKK